MIIKSIDFYGSAAKPNQYPNDLLPQVVLSGRSNVGKSSFINAMLDNHKVARVSQTPGKTRLINFFIINHQFHFVDIPGYGFAKVDKEMLAAFQVMIDRYLESDQPIRLAILLLDIRRIPTEDDLMMKHYFEHKGFPILFVLTKADKLSNNQRFTQRKLILERLGLDQSNRILFFSAKTKENRDELWKAIEAEILVQKEGIHYE